MSIPPSPGQSSGNTQEPSFEEPQPSTSEPSKIACNKKFKAHFYNFPPFADHTTVQCNQLASNVVYGGVALWKRLVLIRRVRLVHISPLPLLLLRVVSNRCGLNRQVQILLLLFHLFRVARTAVTVTVFIFCVLKNTDLKSCRESIHVVSMLCC